MALLPHPPLFLAEIRVTDIWFLLAVGAGWELFARLILLSLKKPQHPQKEQQLQVLQAQCNAKRKLGPSAFVETSKLERQVLRLEQELEGAKEVQAKGVQQTERYLLRYGNLMVAFLVFVLWYGVPVVRVEEVLLGDNKSYLKNLLFPLSSVGVGVRIARWGLPVETAMNSLGALLVVWSAQVTVGKLMDAVDAYVVVVAA